MEDYFFRLVCVDEKNPFGYPILAEKTLESLQDVHKYIDEHIDKHRPDSSKWQLFMFKKDNLLDMLKEPV